MYQRMVSAVLVIAGWSLAAVPFAHVAAQDPQMDPADQPLMLDRVELDNWNVMYGNASEVEINKQKFWQVSLPEGSVITLKRSQVRAVRKPPEAAKEYLSRRDSMADTVEAHWEMQEWCQKNKLMPQREHHLMQIVRLSPDDERARNLLGYSKRDGKWIHDDHFYQGYGYVRDSEGRYRLPMGQEIIESQKTAERISGEWRAKIEGLIRDYRKRGDESALNQFTTITDPAAVEGYKEALWTEMEAGPANIPMQRLLIEAIGRIQSDSAQNTLVRLFMENIGDGDENSWAREIRDACIQQLRQEHFDQRAAVRAVLPFLRAKESDPMHLPSRAARLVGEFGDESTIPWLIDGLVTRHKVLVSAPGGNMQFSEGSGGSGMKMGDKPKFAVIDVKNQVALDALRTKCETVDKGFDKQAWLAWYISEQSLNMTALGRDE
jgi:hypothetical protein